MNKHLKVYLAGKMSDLSFEDMNSWRFELKNLLHCFSEQKGYVLQVINPVDYFNFEEERQQSDAEVEDYDLTHVVSSDVIIVNLDGLNTSIGTAIELHDANYHNRIPVIAFGKKKDYDNLHPWIKRKITRIEETMDSVVEYISDFYMI